MTKQQAIAKLDKMIDKLSDTVGDHISLLKAREEMIMLTAVRQCLLEGISDKLWDNLYAYLRVSVE